MAPRIRTINRKPCLTTFPIDQHCETLKNPHTVRQGGGEGEIPVGVVCPPTCVGWLVLPSFLGLHDTEKAKFWVKTVIYVCFGWGNGHEEKIFNFTCTLTISFSVIHNFALFSFWPGQPVFEDFCCFTSWKSLSQHFRSW